MSAVSIVRALLAADPAVTQFVPADFTSARLVAGSLKQGVALPAISIRSVGGNEQSTTARNLRTKLIRERVQVTVLAKDFPTMEKVLKACSLGRGVHTGVVATFNVRSVIPESFGPYIGPAGDDIHEQSRDFIVTFTEAN